MGRHIKNYYVELLVAAILFSVGYILLAHRKPEYEKVRNFIRQPFSVFYL